MKTIQNVQGGGKSKTFLIRVNDSNILCCIINWCICVIYRFLRRFGLVFLLLSFVVSRDSLVWLSSATDST